jgi:hypothetical protein
MGGPWKPVAKHDRVAAVSTQDVAAGDDLAALVKSMSKSLNALQQQFLTLTNVPQTQGGYGGSKSCSQCGEVGHHRSACPQFLQTIECYQCHQRGHYARVCPSARRGCLGPQAPSQQRRCWQCGEVGHLKHDSPDILQYVECFNCHQKGHYAMVCPSARGGYLSPQPNSQRRCWQCNKVGHLKHDCPDILQHVKCFNCHQKGHYARVCPSARGRCPSFHPHLQHRCRQCNKVGHIKRDCPDVLQCVEGHQREHYVWALHPVTNYQAHAKSDVQNVRHIPVVVSAG